MKTPKIHRAAKSAILALADVKSAVAAFDRGDLNVFAALDAILVAVEFRSDVTQAGREPRRRRRAA